MHRPQDDGSDGILPGAHFVDTCRMALGSSPIDAPAAVALLFDRPPRWASALMAARDRFVAPLGLKAAGKGPFPVLASSPSEVVMGMDDRHLDFRIVVRIAPGDGKPCAMTLTTLVRTRNLLGRAYLAAVLPFHWAISRRMASELARRTR